MPRLLLSSLALLLSFISADAQHNPWEWQKDQNKYALYEATPRARVPSKYTLFANPVQPTGSIYRGNKEGYGRYIAYIVNSYRSTYRLRAAQVNRLRKGLLGMYNSSEGVRATSVHAFLSTNLREMLSNEQFIRWQRTQVYPEFDPYYLEMGRP